MYANTFHFMCRLLPLQGRGQKIIENLATVKINISDPASAVSQELYR